MKVIDVLVVVVTVMPCLGAGANAHAQPVAPALSLGINEPEDVCVQPGEPVTVTLSMSSLPEPVRGYQAFLSFDASGLTFDSGVYVVPDPFGLPIIVPIVAVADCIDLAAGIDDSGGQSPTMDDALLVTLHFTAGTVEGPTTVDFRSHDPPSRFAGEFGGEVLPLLIDSPTITVDGTAPAITCPPNVFVRHDESTAPSNTGTATAVDNLDPAPTITFSDSVAGGSCPQESVITRTWTATDCAGNSRSCDQIITVLPETASVNVLEFLLAPGSGCVQPGETVTVELHQRGLGQPVRGFQAFAQFDSSVMTHSSTTFTTWPYGQEILNFVAGDDINLAAGIDNPGGQSPTMDDALLVTLAFTAGATEGPTTVDFRYHEPPTRFTDELGGEVLPCLTGSPAIVIDGTDPVVTCPGDVTIECDESSDPSHTGPATATDNFDPDPTIAFSDSIIPGSCPQESVITRTWTATDCAGNSHSCDQIITVADTTLPVIVCPPDTTIGCGESADPAETGTAAATDNCDPVPTIAYSDVSSGECPTLITRTWTATDGCGHSSSCVQSIWGACAVSVTVRGCAVPPMRHDCQGRVIRMTFEYTGEGCAASNHNQSPESATCSGDAAMSEPVRILITNGGGEKVYADVSNVYLGGAVVADSANVNESRLDPHVWIRIYDAGDVLLEESEFHASCSQPLNVGDQFGSMLVVAMTTTLGGEVTIGDLVSCITNIPGTLPGADVEYTYVVTNDSAVTLTNVTVIDDVFGEIPGSPIASIGPGEGATLMLTVFVSGETTNTVTVHAHVGDVECVGTATTTITVGLADCDSDGDTDLDDLQQFVDCLTGPGGGLLFECECVDLDGDLDVDLTDFAVFQTAFTASL